MRMQKSLYPFADDKALSGRERGSLVQRGLSPADGDVAHQAQERYLQVQACLFL